MNFTHMSKPAVDLSVNCGICAVKLVCVEDRGYNK